jgi:hypothetical protein
MSKSRKESIAMTQSAFVIAVVLAIAAPAGAQDKPSAPLIPVKLQLVFEKYQGAKRVSSEPYTLSVTANDKNPNNPNNGRPGKIRMGIDVPMRAERAGDRDVPGNVVYRSIGNSADCVVASLDEVRFKIDCNFEQSSISRDPQRSQADALAPPMLRTFRSETAVILRDKESAQYVAATDPVSGEELKVGITLLVSR